MEDGEKNQNVEKDPPRQPIAGIFNARAILQSFWIRCRSVFLNVVDREFMESQLYLVLCCGSILWFLLILEEII